MIIKNAVGILGGSFNPAHNGHIQLALAAVKHMGLESAQLVPCAVPPHKTTSKILPFALRVNLLKAAAKNFPQLSVNPLEGDLPSPSYTWNTLIAWKKIYPNKQPVFILSCEEFSKLNSWHNGVRLPQLAHFLVAPRGDSGRSAYIEALKNIWNCTDVEAVKGKGSILRASPFKTYGCFFLPLAVKNARSEIIRRLWISRGLYLKKMLQKPIIKILRDNKSEIKNYWHN